MHIRKILLLNPSNTVEKECIRRVVTPIGLLYLASVLEGSGYEVSVLDSPCEGYDITTVKGEYVTYGLSDAVIKERIVAFKPDVVGITHPFSYLEKQIYGLCKLTKSISKDIVTVAGGVHPSFSAEEMLSKCKELDYVILGEGERRFLRLLDLLNSKGSLLSLDGIAFREGGRIILNPALSFIRDLDSVPFPARHLIDMEKYIKINKPANPFLKRERSERIFTSRGCPFKCCFCGGQRFWKNIRMRSADNVINELRLLKEKHRIQEIQFSDDNLTVDKKRAMELFIKMKELDFVWCTPSGIMISTLDEKMIKAMADSGCYQVTISPESGSQRVLDKIIHKPINLKSIKPLVKILHKYDINVHSNFILGLPGETKEELMQTFSYAKEIEVDSAAFFIAVPYPGTPLHDLCKKKGWLGKDMATADFKHANIHIKKGEKEYVMPKKELVSLVDEKTKEFNDWSKKRNPEAWAKKYSLFLNKNRDTSRQIEGRVV